ncbi:MAG: hypothetical protein FJ220_03935 [Kiritimatiellaceae bacterium]|nr:hypothetical protein [Kiritimatiellaceae bacterium]
MNWGCLSCLILFPVGFFIWVKNEVQRRNALPPNELKELEDEERYGKIDDDLECIFCHSKQCVRAEKKIYYRGGPDKNSLDGLLFYSANQKKYSEIREDVFLAAHCTKCGNTWEMHPPEDES